MSILIRIFGQALFLLVASFMSQSAQGAPDLTIQEIEEFEKDLPPEEETYIVEPTNIVRNYSDILFMVGYNFFGKIDRLGFDQEYPTDLLIKLKDEGHYRIWCRNCATYRDLNVVVSKNIRPTRVYLFMFFLAAMVWFQARRV